jgi:hypothetical protein
MAWTSQELVDYHRRQIRDHERLRDRINAGVGPEADALKARLPVIEAELEQMRLELARTKSWIARLAELN